MAAADTAVVTIPEALLLATLTLTLTLTLNLTLVYT